MRFPISVIGSLLCILLASSPSWSQRPQTNLRGTVRLPANVGVSTGVRIQLQKLGMAIDEVFLHDSQFELMNVERGHYTIVVEAPDYATVMQEVDVPGAWLVIELHPRRNPVRPAETVSIGDFKIPESARRQFQAAARKLREHNCTDAFDHLKKAIRRYAEYGDAHKAMGECYAELNQLEAAEQEFKLALEQPHTADLHLLLGKIYAREDNRMMVPHQLDLYLEEKPVRQPH